MPVEKEKAIALAVAEQRQREERERVEQQHKIKEENDRLVAEKKKKKPVRYPTEDLDVVLNEKDKRAGMKVKRPVPSKFAMPFGEDQETNAAFLMSWNFLVVYGYVGDGIGVLSSHLRMYQPTTPHVFLHDG